VDPPPLRISRLWLAGESAGHVPSRLRLPDTISHVRLYNEHMRRLHSPRRHVLENDPRHPRLNRLLAYYPALMVQNAIWLTADGEKVRPPNQSPRRTCSNRRRSPRSGILIFGWFVSFNGARSTFSSRILSIIKRFSRSKRSQDYSRNGSNAHEEWSGSGLVHTVDRNRNHASRWHAASIRR